MNVICELYNITRWSSDMTLAKHYSITIISAISFYNVCKSGRMCTMCP